MYPVNDLEAIALTMLGEARGEGAIGMEDVGHVILNRVAHPSWRGRTILEVCLKPWQFSCWNSCDPNQTYLINIQEEDDIYQNAAALGQKLLSGELPDTTKGATYYYRIGTAPPVWAAGHTPCYVSGHHVFYKDVA